MGTLTAVNLIGAGRIGVEVAQWLRVSDRYTLQGVIRRGETPPPAPLTIDCAGPSALRAHGESCLATGDLWTVGAAALIDDDLRARLEGASNGHELRLFTGWITGPALCPPGTPARLHIAQYGPGLAPEPGLLFEGPLAQAAARFPDHLNTATAAALCGPGIAATTIALHSATGDHIIRASFQMPGQVIETETRFGTGPHPVAQAIIAALERRGDWLRYG